MDSSLQIQSSPAETKPVIELGSVWIDASHESILYVRIATEDNPLPNAVSMCFSKFRGKLISLDADSIINPERHKKIWPAPDVNAELLAALNKCDKAFVAWQVGQIPGRPEDILELITEVRAAIFKAEGGAQ